MVRPDRKVLLVILDGFGISPAKANNAIALANTPNIDHYLTQYPHTAIQAAGPAVGLPDGQMGNSEVGHLTLGCGATIRQDLVKINNAIERDDFVRNPALLDACANAKEQNQPLHLMGLVSDGGVHSHIDHILALIDLARQQQVRPLLHMITDGRDTAPHSALDYLAIVEPALQAAGGAIASVCGRFYAMDRDKRWDRTERAWRLFTLGKGRKANNAKTAIETAYACDESDEFIQPSVLEAWEPVAHDAPLIFFNFRKDRPRQIVASLSQDDFRGFDRGEWSKPQVTCMMSYDQTFQLPCAFEPELPQTCLGEQLSRAHLRQLHLAETEKYAHVTYFFNGGRQNPFWGEKQLLIPSPKVKTYDLAPEMSASKLADVVISALNGSEFDFVLVNFANGDMVGHTASVDAVIHAIEALDREVGRILDMAVHCDWTALVTADHGNCEEFIDPITGAPQTQHTPYPVPFMIIDRSDWVLSTAGTLAGVAPTVLQLLGLEIPKSMDGRPLLVRELPRQVEKEEFESAA